MLAFCYRGSPLKWLLPPKRHLPLKFSKNNRKNNRNNRILFKNSGLLSLAHLRFFSSRKPECPRQISYCELSGFWLAVTMKMILMFCKTHTERFSNMFPSRSIVFLTYGNIYFYISWNGPLAPNLSRLGLATQTWQTNLRTSSCHSFLFRKREDICKKVLKQNLQNSFNLISWSEMLSIWSVLWRQWWTVDECKSLVFWHVATSSDSAIYDWPSVACTDIHLWYFNWIEQKTIIKDGDEKNTVWKNVQYTMMVT